MTNIREPREQRKEETNYSTSKANKLSILTANSFQIIISYLCDNKVDCKHPDGVLSFDL